MITLVIIGVIAAITVPTLINKTNNQEYVSKLKKTYSTLAQATNQIIAEEGSPKNGWVSSGDNIYKLYKKHLKNVKDCGTGTGCYSQGTIKTLKGTVSSDNFDINLKGDYKKLISADGVQIIFEYISDTCSSSIVGTNNVCAWIHVDLNGEKKPNQIGRDLFLFALKSNGLFPAGCDNPENSNAKCDTNSQGWGCACKVLREGAINY